MQIEIKKKIKVLIFCTKLITIDENTEKRMKKKIVQHCELNKI